ncbi:MAG TPA: carboxypeptidase regulatory-like domain-containing protein [Armatimonadota bacterium]|nr:carboxypeptidase regulatory-like domain-containing protein [Armatimonadota bacterium]
MHVRTGRMALFCCSAALLALPGLALAAVDGGDQEFVLRGRVVTEDGNPVEGGTVCFDQRALKGPITDGRFELRVTGSQPVERGTHSVIYTGEGGYVVVVDTIRTVAGQKEAYVRLKVGGPPVVSGRVVWRGGSVPAPEVVVSLRRALAEDRSIDWTLSPDVDGSFRVYGTSLTHCRLRAHAQDNIQHPKLKTDWVDIRPPFPMYVTLRLPAGPSLVGRVVDAQGRPVAGAIVLYSIRDVPGVGAATTKEDGAFVFVLSEPGEYCVDTYAKGFGHSAISVDVLDSPEIAFAQVELAPAPMHTVRGHILGPEGQTGIAGAKLEFWASALPSPCGRTNVGGSWTYPSSLLYETVADEQGEFYIDIPTDLDWSWGAPVTWSVKVQADGYLERRYTGFSPASSPEYLEFRLFRGGVISGKVILEGDVPRHSRAVLLVPAGVIPGSGASGGDMVSAEVALDGEFELRGPPGEHWLCVELPGLPDPVARVRLEEGKTISVTVAPPPGIVLEGTVVNAQTEEPVAGATVSGNRRDARTDRVDHAGANTDEQGRYRLSPLSPGEIRLFVSALGMTMGERAVEAAQPGAQVVDFQLAPQQPAAAPDPG